MVDYNEKIKELEQELATTKYNKRSQHHIGLVKAKIAQLRERDEARRGGGGKTEGYSVKKSGDATVVLLGFPSVGKSTLLNALTDADSPVGAYAFTTLTVIPGLLEHKFAKIQILDVPGIVRGAAAGTGRGKEVLQTLRNADLILFLLDAQHPEHYPVLQKEVRDAHVRVNEDLPHVKIAKQPKGGIQLGYTVKQELDADTIKDVLKEFSIINAEVVVREKLTVDRLIDAIEANKHYTKGITILNKADLVSEEALKKVKKKVKANLAISAQKQDHIEELKDVIYDALNFMQLFLKEPGKDADMEEPLIVKKGSTIRNVCEGLHKDFVDKFRFARVTGPSAKFANQRFTKRHTLKDGDILEIHLS